MERHTQLIDTPEENATASFLIQPPFKRRIKEMAAAQDLSESQIMRRILDDYFSRLDAAPALAPTNGKAATK